MKTASAIRAEMKSLATSAHNASKNPSLTNVEKTKALEECETKLKALADELHVADQADKLGLLDLGGDHSSASTRSLASFGLASNTNTNTAPPVVLDDTQMKALFDAASAGQGYAVEMKAATDSTSVAPALIPDYRLPPLPFRREPTRVLNLMRVTPTNATEVDYFKITTAASAAAAVAEGAAKPQSSPVYAKSTAPVRKIAHYVELTDETLMDFPTFAAVITEELLAGLILAENAELLTGSGTAPHLTGLLNTSGILTRARSTETQLDAILEATTDLRAGSSYVQADGIVLNPADAQTIFLAKDSQGRYIAGNPLEATSTNIWGIRVVITTQMTAGTALVGSFAEMGQAFMRMAPRVDTANQGTTQFINNTTLIRCEERLALAVERPTALVKVTGL